MARASYTGTHKRPYTTFTPSEPHAPSLPSTLSPYAVHSVWLTTMDGSVPADSVNHETAITPEALPIASAVFISPQLLALASFIVAAVVLGAHSGFTQLPAVPFMLKIHCSSCLLPQAKKLYSRQCIVSGWPARLRQNCLAIDCTYNANPSVAGVPRLIAPVACLQTNPADTNEHADQPVCINLTTTRVTHSRRRPGPSAYTRTVQGAYS